MHILSLNNLSHDALGFDEHKMLNISNVIFSLSTSYLDFDKHLKKCSFQGHILCYKADLEHLKFRKYLCFQSNILCCVCVTRRTQPGAEAAHLNDNRHQQTIIHTCICTIIHLYALVFVPQYACICTIICLYLYQNMLVFVPKHASICTIMCL